MKLHIQTQIQENYGAHDWDGQGQVPQYWKFKGGSDYFVKGINNDTEATMAVMSLRAQIEENNEYFKEIIIGWDLVSDDYLTEFERDQLEYDGKITYPAKTLTW